MDTPADPNSDASLTPADDAPEPVGIVSEDYFLEVLRRPDVQEALERARELRIDSDSG